MIIIVLVLAGYALVYGAPEMGREATSRWSGVSSKYRRSGTGPQKAAVVAVDGIGWITASFARGVARAAKDDWATLKTIPARRRARAEKRRAKAEERERLAAEREAEEEAIRTQEQDAPEAIDTPSNPDALPEADPTVNIPLPTPESNTTAVNPVPTQGTSPEGDTPMATSAPTGEAGTYEATLAAYDSQIAHANRMAIEAGELAGASEQLAAGQRSSGLDDKTIAGTNEVLASAIEARGTFLAIAANAAKAKQTFEAEQGHVREALTAQQQTADADFYRS